MSADGKATLAVAGDVLPEPGNVEADTDVDAHAGEEACEEPRAEVDRVGNEDGVAHDSNEAEREDDLVPHRVAVGYEGADEVDDSSPGVDGGRERLAYNRRVAEAIDDDNKESGLVLAKRADRGVTHEAIHARVHAEEDKAGEIDHRIADVLLELIPTEALIARVDGRLGVADLHKELLALGEVRCGLVAVGDGEEGPDADDNGDGALDDVEPPPTGEVP